MSPRARGFVPIAIVVCASVSALVFKGTTEWLIDLFVSACGGLACRLKESAPKDDEARRPGWGRRPCSRRPSRNARHRAARSGVRRPRAHRPTRIRPLIGPSMASAPEGTMADARCPIPEGAGAKAEGSGGLKGISLGHRPSAIGHSRAEAPSGMPSHPEPEAIEAGLGV